MSIFETLKSHNIRNIREQLFPPSMLILLLLIASGFYLFGPRFLYSVDVFAWPEFALTYGQIFLIIVADLLSF